MVLPESWLGIIAAVILGLVTLAATFVKWRFNYWRRLGVPYIKPSFPFGNAKDSVLGRRQFAILLQDLYNELEGKPYGGVYMALQPTLLLREPELIRDVMVKYFSTHFQHRIAKPHEKLDPVLFNNLFMLRSSKWKSLRNHLSPTFTSGKMKMMYHLVQKKAEMLVDRMERNITEKDYTMDMKELLSLYTTDAISSCAFGIETNSLNNPDNEFRLMGKEIFIQTFKHLLNTLIIFQFPSFVNLTRAVFITPEVTDFFRKVVWEVVDEREKKGIFRGDFLDLLIQLKNTGRIQDTDAADNIKGKAEPRLVGPKKAIESDLKNFDGDDFVSQVVLFFAAGFETSSTTASFGLFEIAANPEVQDRLAEEVDATLDVIDGQITYEAVLGMRYLDMVVNETLRKYPPLAVVDRECTKEYRNPEYNLVIPKGTPVMVPLIGLHRDPRFFPDPEKFEPERFSEENVKQIPNYCYMPFGVGPRNCIGMRFGLLQAKVALVYVISRFRVSLTDELKGRRSLPLDPKSFMLAVDGGIPLVVTRRTPQHQTDA